MASTSGWKCSTPIVARGPIVPARRLPPRLGSAVVVIAMLAGCSGPGEQIGQQAAPSPAVLDDAQYRAETLGRLAEDRGITEPPEVDVVRWIDRSEESSALADCLTSEGFAATATEDGGMESEFTVDQEPAYNLALYTCTARFPVRAWVEEIPDDEGIREIYDYFTGTVVPCLQREGADVGDVPTWDTFRGTFMSGAWSPYAALVEARTLTPELVSACPEHPQPAP